MSDGQTIIVNSGESITDTSIEQSQNYEEAEQAEYAAIMAELETKEVETKEVETKNVSLDTDTDKKEEKEEAEKSEPDQKVEEKTEDKKDGKEGKTETETDAEKAEVEDAINKEKAGILKALQSEREKSKQFKAEVEALNKKLSQLPTIDPTFKLLTTEEYNSLTEDDPAEALQYLHNKAEYEKKQIMQEGIADKYRSIIDTSRQTIINEMPDLADPESDLNKNLAEHGYGYGFDQESLWGLTNAGTMILYPGSDTPVPLGNAAASVIRLLAGSHNSKATFSKREAEIRKDERDKVTKEITKKFIKQAGGESYKSLGDVNTGGGDEVPISERILSEEEIAALSPAQQKKWLYGE